MNNFERFLERKSQNYGAIDRFRAFKMFEKYKEHLSLKPIIHIIGTNGKGSTGRFLAQLLRKLDYKVGHYTSPHIFKFNERFWLNDNIITDEELENAHTHLESVFQQDLEKLSYFEYATFLAVVLFKQCDFIIFEAGLGGEYDASSLFDKRISIFTKIGFDHMQILGFSLKEIARTKLKVMSKEAVISDEQEDEVLDLAKKISLLKGATLHSPSKLLDMKLKAELQQYAQKYNLIDFLKHNLGLACAALVCLLGAKNALKALKKLEKLDLRGRCEKIAANVYVDVGHNQMAASALANFFKGQKFILIYNAFLDKDNFEILRILKPIIDKIEIYKYQSPQRQLADKKIVEISNHYGIVCEKFNKIQADKKYLVFGSFLLVEHFVRDNFEKA